MDVIWSKREEIMPKKYHEFRNFAAKCHGLRKNIYDFLRILPVIRRKCTVKHALMEAKEITKM